MALIALLMMVLAVFDILGALLSGGISGETILNSVSLIVISIAIFDVGKYLMEEEIIREKEMRSPSEARKTLTKFMVIIIIAISLEALVFVFTAGKEDLTLLLYPSILLFTATCTIIGLGVFQRLSVTTEEKVTHDKK